jgi:hypothetical protein
MTAYRRELSDINKTEPAKCLKEAMRSNVIINEIKKVKSNRQSIGVRHIILCVLLSSRPRQGENECGALKWVNRAVINREFSVANAAVCRASRKINERSLLFSMKSVNGEIISTENESLSVSVGDLTKSESYWYSLPAWVARHHLRAARLSLILAYDTNTNSNCTKMWWLIAVRYSAAPFWLNGQCTIDASVGVAWFQM